jgi:PhzF family phenazine biosynthesis protein
MTQEPPEFGEVLNRPATLATALGLTEDDLIPALPAQVVSTGTPHLLVAVLRASLFRARPDATKLGAVLKKAGAQGCYLYTIEGTDPGVVADARFFNPTAGIVEDAATGSAAGPLACYIRRVSPKTGPGMVIAQGAAMGRPSRLRIDVRDTLVQLIGSGIVVAEGTLRL